jgi:hypothetical protein
MEKLNGIKLSETEWSEIRKSKWSKTEGSYLERVKQKARWKKKLNARKCKV